MGKQRTHRDTAGTDRDDASTSRGTLGTAWSHQTPEEGVGRASLRATERDPPADTSSLDICLLSRERTDAHCFKPPHLRRSEPDSGFYPPQDQAPLGAAPTAEPSLPGSGGRVSRCVCSLGPGRPQGPARDGRLPRRNGMSRLTDLGENVSTGGHSAFPGVTGRVGGQPGTQSVHTPGLQVPVRTPRLQ